MPHRISACVRCAPDGLSPELRQRVAACAACDARALSLCQAIPDSRFDRLAAISTALAVAPGGTFIEEGEPADSFFNITCGTVKLYKLLPDGRRQITGFLGIGDFLGLAVSDSYVFTAEAIDAVRVCRFSRRRLNAVLDDFPALERKLLEIASHELVAAQEQMLLLGRKTALERLASFLLGRAHRAASLGARGIPLAMTRTDIADYLGLTIETVSRLMSRLRRERVIALPEAHGLTVLDRPALRRYSGGEGPII
jgi:CRP/FNR family transcriptional regulator, anaerobic regulatory protein